MGKAKAKKATKQTSTKKPGANHAPKKTAKASAPKRVAKAAPARKPANGGGKAKPAAKASSGSSATTSARALSELQARWPALNDKEIEAFDSLVSDGQADDLGKRTKATDVLREAARWAGTIDAALRQYGDGALKGYSARRFAYFLHNANTLAATLASEETRKSAVDTTRDGAEDARGEAVRARAATIDRLATFAGMRVAERTALEDASGTDTTQSVERLVRALRALAFLEVDWLERNDPASQVLAESAGLSHENAQELRSYAEALSSKKVATLLEGARPGKDTPTINRIEGRTLFEMREAKRVFAAAHDHNAVVPHLVPGAAIAHAFGPKQAKKPAAGANGKAVSPSADGAGTVETSPS